MNFYSLPTGLKRLVVITLITFVWILSVQLFQFTFATEGTASWYGPNFAGKLTANGEIYNPRELTAAHQSLAFNTVVRVTNLRNGQSVDVRINDRGPYIDNRIIDLSEAAAERIGMKYVGIETVHLAILKSGDPPPDINPVNLSTYANNASSTNSVVNNTSGISYPNSINDNYSGVQEPSALQNVLTNVVPTNNTSSTIASSALNTRPYEPVKPLPFKVDEAVTANHSNDLPNNATNGRITNNNVANYSSTNNDAANYTVTKYSAVQTTVTKDVVSSEQTKTTSTTKARQANVLKLDTMAGLTLQEVIVPNYPIGTQFLLGSSQGDSVWVQVINNQLPPHIENTFLISQELLNVLGQDLQLLQQQ